MWKEMITKLNYHTKWKKKLSVKKSLSSDLITTGINTENFEKKFKKKVGSKYAISCNSGTSALFLAYKSLDLKRGDNIIMPVVNFVASYNVAKFLGLNVYLCDVDSISGQITPEILENFLKKKKLKKIKAVVLMYMGGFVGKVEKFYKLKKKYNFKIIEDACHALGAKYKFSGKNYYIGSCVHSDICVFSLHPLKTITSGEGGVLTTNNKQYHSRSKIYRSHGIIRNKSKHWIYDVIDNSFNFRLSDLNCALASTQLLKVDKFINGRKKIYENYLKHFNKLNLYIEFMNDIKNYPSFHLALAKIRFNKLKINKGQFLHKLKKLGIICQFHYIPIYNFKISNHKKRNFPGAINYEKETISIPIYYNLSKKDQKFVIDMISKIIVKNKND